ncbi:MAG: hypothetical protein RKE49_09760 [Oceanicaulis sp.]
MSGPPVLIIQDSWVYWTKQSRGADRPVQRPRLDGPARLPALPPAGETVWRHDRYAVEPDGFALRDVCRAGLPPEPLRGVAGGFDVLGLRRRGEAFELRIAEPYPDMRQTRWPVLPALLRTLTPGDVIRIDWNVRARRSLTGAHRGSFFEAHTIFVAFTAEADRALFLNAAPERCYDFTTRIY